MAKFTIGEALGFAWSKVRKHFWFVVLWAAGTVFVSMAFSGGDHRGPGDSILSILGIIVSTFITIGGIRIAIKLLEDKRGGINDFLPTWEMFWNLFFASALYSIIVCVGLVLLIFPAFIWAPKYSQAMFLVVDKNMGPIQALKESARITMGSKKKLVAYFFASIGVVLLGLIALLVGLFVALPLVMIASAHIYKKLSGEALVVSPGANSVEGTISVA